MTYVVHYLLLLLFGEGNENRLVTWSSVQHQARAAPTVERAMQPMIGIVLA
jgi:hypothetical protein